MVVFGLDGCRGGWVAVGIDEGAPTIAFPDDIAWLADRPFGRAMIDMPIGLPEIGPRECDLLARQALRPHASRVFTGAQRLILSGEDQRTVNARLKAMGHGGISIQLANLRPKIEAVDRFVRNNRALAVGECHPELVFQRLNGGEPLASKHSREGFARRQALLEGVFPELGSWLVSRNRRGAKPDDVLDACACAIAARDVGLGNCLPAEAPRDPHGIPMQIWY